MSVVEPRRLLRSMFDAAIAAAQPALFVPPGTTHLLRIAQLT